MRWIKKIKQNHRRAFTLLELLAVILILGIIALIALPVVNNVIITARKKSFAVEVQTVRREAEKQYMADYLAGNKNYTYCNSGLDTTSCAKITLSKKDMNYIVKLDNNGHAVEAYVSNGQYCFASKELVDEEDIAYNQIEQGALDCSTGECLCYNEKGQGKVTVVVKNGQSSGNSVIVKNGDDISFVITPDNEYSLEDAVVSGACTLEGDKIVFKDVTGSKTCNIVLSKQKYPVTLNCDYCTQLTQTHNVELKESTEFTVVPATGYMLTDATLTGEGCTLNNNVVTFANVTGTRSCSLSLSKQIHKISTTCTGCASDISDVEVEHGTSKSIELTAGTGYNLTDATAYGDGCSIAGSSLLVSSVKKDVSCVVNLSKNKYNVNISCNGCSATPTTVQVEHGGSSTITIAAAANYSLTGATASGTGCAISGSTLTVSNVVGATTCTVTAKASWKCTEGTLTADSSKGSSTGGYVCVTGPKQSCSSYEPCIQQTPNECCGYGPDDSCNCWGSSCVAWGPTEYSCSYSCPSGWKKYSGSGSSMKCYKAANK